MQNRRIILCKYYINIILYYNIILCKNYIIPFLKNDDVTLKNRFFFFN